MMEFLLPLPVLKESWRGASDHVRQAWTNDFLVVHPDINKIFSDFKEKLEHVVRSGKYGAMLVLGETGSGKTTLATLFRRYGIRRFARVDEEKTVCPVIQFAIPDPCTPFEISVSILSALGELRPRLRKSKADTIKAAQLLMNTCEVKCVLIDNFQDIPARRARRGIELVGARLRELIDASSALWVLLGTDEALKVVDSDPQLIKRVAYRGQLRYFSIKGSTEQRAFLLLLKKIDEWLPLAEQSCLADPKISGRVFVATHGVFDRIVQLVDRGWHECVRNGREAMELRDLQNAFDYVYGPTAKHLNPFEEQFVPRVLNGSNEPFEVLAKEVPKC